MDLRPYVRGVGNSNFDQNILRSVPYLIVIIISYYQLFSFDAVVAY